MIIAHNLSAMNANRMFNINGRNNKKTVEKLSSGYRINRSADDAAGLAISEKMRRQIRGLTQASINAQDGVSLCQVAEGALTESHDILQRMNELAVKAANGTNVTEDCEAIQAEMDNLVEELDRIANQTSFNKGLYPLNGGSELPPSIGSVPITVVNNSTGIVKCDGKEYQPGESFVIPDVLAIMKAPDYTKHSEAAICQPGAGYTSASTFVVTGSSPTINIAYAKLSDLKQEGNGYLYIENIMNTGDNRYIGPTQFEYVANPTAENLENEGIQKMVDKQQDVTLQVGAEAGQTITFSLVNVTATTLGVKPINVMDAGAAGNAITKVEGAIEKVSQYRSKFGAIQNRLEHTIANLNNVVENTQAAESLIRDTDMAEEMVKYSNNNIVAQAGQSMLAQANQMPQHVLSLLQ